MLRVITYNIHSGIGMDRRRDYARIGQFLSSVDADIVFLQEVETRERKTGMTSEAVLSDLAGERFGHMVSGPALKDESGWFGNVILSRFPVPGHEVVDISVERREPRTIIDAQVQTPGGILRVMNTHKGLSRRERYSQLEKLEILLAREMELPLIIGGDINEWFARSGMLRRLNTALHLCSVQATFPVRCPLIHLDRIWCRPASLLHSARRVRTKETMVYSDHYPVLAEINF